MLPTVRALVTLGGSGNGREINDQVVDDQGFTDEQIGLTYETNDKSILLDRIAWARSYCKLGGVFESPRRSLFLLTETGAAIAEMADGEAAAALLELDNTVRKNRRAKKPTASTIDTDEPDQDDSEDDERWKDQVLQTLHALSPDAFERFCLYLLRSFGMELKRVGGPNDEGIDGIGTAPLTDVLTTTVAVQAKRYEPSKTVGRETVALFQSDAVAAGAEHGVLITTARFSKPARNAALGRTPTIDLIDGDRLAELCDKQSVGVSRQPVVDAHWFGRFEQD